MQTRYGWVLLMVLTAKVVLHHYNPAITQILSGMDNAVSFPVQLHPCWKNTETTIYGTNHFVSAVWFNSIVFRANWSILLFFVFAHGLWL